MVAIRPKLCYVLTLFANKNINYKNILLCERNSGNLLAPTFHNCFIKIHMLVIYIYVNKCRKKRNMYNHIYLRVFDRNTSTLV